MPTNLAADLRARKAGVIDDLLAEYGAAIGSVAFLIVRNGADAEEIDMDTMVIAWRNASQLRHDGAMRTWLLRIATRQALSRRRQRKPTQPLESALALTGQGEPSLDRVLVADVLDALPARQRAAVALHHVAGLTVSQTAEAMGVSENTTKTQLREGMARLRATLEAPQADGESRRATDVRGA